MGMFDNVYVAADNKVRIPTPESFYQTRDFDCLLVDYQIDIDGRFSVKKKGLYEAGFEEEVKLGVLTGTACIYGEGEDGIHRDLFLYIERNQVKFVFSWGKVLYKADDVNIESMHAQFSDEYFGEFEFLLREGE